MTTSFPEGETHGLRHGYGHVDTTWLTPNYASNPFGIDEWFLPYINPPNSFIHYPINKNIKPTWISTQWHMKCAIWRWLYFIRKCQSKKQSCFCCVGSSCKGIDPNQRLPLQCKISMSINDVCFDISGIFLMFHVVKWPLCSHQHFSLAFGHSLFFKKIITYMYLETWENLRGPNARWLTSSGLHMLTWEFVEALNYWVIIM